MFGIFYPCAYLKSVFEIDFQKLYNKGYRGILFDVDNTLVHHGDDSTPQIDALFDSLHKIGFKTLILTNNNEERVKRFLKNIDSEYICEANKPDTAGYLKSLEMLGISKKEAICIGDQIFTDICGANKSGIDSILVEFIRVSENEKIGKRRHVENFILKFYRFSKSYRKLGDIVKGNNNNVME